MREHLQSQLGCSSICSTLFLTHVLYASSSCITVINSIIAKDTNNIVLMVKQALLTCYEIVQQLAILSIK